MEPERKIEKLLRAFAKKRRAEAGEPLKLHPAMRRLLQDEIARRAAKPEEDDSLSLWQLLRQHWAFLFGFALIMFCLATMFLPALSGAKRKAQNLSAMSNLKQIGVAAQMAAANDNGKLPASLEALTNILLSDTTLIDPQSGKPFLYSAGGKNLDTLQTNTVLAYSAEGRNGRAVLLANGSVEYANQQRFFELTNQAPMEVDLAKDTLREPRPAAADQISPSMMPPPPAVQAEGEINASAPAAAPAPAKMDSIQFGGRASQVFDRKKAGGLQNLFKNNSLSTKTGLVLANFQMEQNGENLRILDADGSVYEGPWQITQGIAQNATKEPQIAANTGLPVETPAQTQAQTYASKLSSNNGAQLIAQNYFFRVAGTNLTLRQNVVFTGNLTIISAAQPITHAPPGGNMQADNEKQQKAANYPQQFIWSNTRIAGTAVVGETNRIEIDATLP